MHPIRLIVKEILHRRLSFVLALAAAAAAVACLVGVVLLIDGYDCQTQGILEKHRAEVEAQATQLKDDVRKITKGLGFNVLILPKDQDLADVYAEGYAQKTMPESYVHRLAEARDVVTVAHLLPALEQKVLWPERDRTIVLVGIRGEVPFVSREAKKPLLDPVEPGTVVLGHELGAQFDLAKGDEVALLGESFTVAGVYPARGTKDDITAWIDLEQAQALLEKEDEINVIWALNCNCESIERLAEVRAEISRVLPETQVIELAGRATARAEARNRAHAEAVAAMERDQRHRAEMRDRIEGLAAVIVPLVVVASGVGVGLLALGNVRDRREEIGILRALGFRSSQLLAVFLGRAAVVGLGGAVAGGAAGLVIGGGAVGGMDMSWSTAWPVLAVVIIAAPLLCAVASWLPAVVAARQDPAVVLREE